MPPDGNTEHNTKQEVVGQSKINNASRTPSQFLGNVENRGTCFTTPQGCSHQNPDGGKFYWADGLVSSTEKNVTHKKKMKMEPIALKWLKRHK